MPKLDEFEFECSAEDNNRNLFQGRTFSWEVKNPNTRLRILLRSSSQLLRSAWEVLRIHLSGITKATIVAWNVRFRSENPQSNILALIGRKLSKRSSADPAGHRVTITFCPKKIHQAGARRRIFIVQGPAGASGARAHLAIFIFFGFSWFARSVTCALFRR